MSTKSIIVTPEIDDPLCQGDIFTNVKYNFISKDSDDEIEITELEFPMAIIISQACDVIFMDEMLKNKLGNSSKYMPSILMCPIYNYELSKNGKHLAEISNKTNISIIEDNTFNSSDKNIANKDWHYRLHMLTLAEKGDKANQIENASIDFKHYFTVPAKYLYDNKNNRIYKLDPIYSEQITLKFATFLTRVGIPDEN